MSHFEKLTSFSVDYASTHITKWRSKRTGLQITYIDRSSPIVEGYFALATEIANDSGAPHTLEHLVFMGSKKYPYKGLLDTLGNRFSSETNAWTGVDQTVYTLTTAGWDACKPLLPIYLDHILNPTLTDEACLTEVYHIDGNGKEKGVVFSEMQGLESQSWFITFLAMQRSLYAKDSGYSSETGGLMSQLRHLTNDQIREFHKSLYRPDNLCVILTGKINSEELIEMMSKFDQDLPSLPSTPNKRPFIDSKKDLPLTETLVKIVDFPDTDESFGDITIAWIGPQFDDLVECLALEVVGGYFTDSAISILNKHLVETENPLATETDFSTDDYYRTTLNIVISGVPTDSLSEVDTKVKELIREQTDPEAVDISYFRQVLKQQKLKYISNSEQSSSSFANVAIGEFIYGKNDGSDLKSWLSFKDYDTLDKWSVSDWASFIDKYLVKNHSISILGKPSSKLNDFLETQNEQILASIKKKYGESGLRKLEEQLEKAQEKNNEPIPDKLFTELDRPDPTKINFIQTQSYRAGSNNNELNYVSEDSFAKYLKDDSPKDMPIFFHFEGFKSQFTTISLVMNTKCIEPRLLKYMAVFEEIFNLSMHLPSGKYLNYEEVVSRMNDDLISFHVDNGFESEFSEVISIKMKFETKNYAKAVEWIFNTLKHSLFEESRIKTIVEKIVNSLTEKKRNESFVLYSTYHRHLFDDASLLRAHDSINTEFFYKDILQKISDGKFQEIQKDLETLRDGLCSPMNFKVFVMGNLTHLEKPVSSWKIFTEEPYSKKDQFAVIPRSFEYRSKLGDMCSKSAFVVVPPGAESSYSVSSTLFPRDYVNDDSIKLSLACKLLTAVEGPFWRGIRGVGLAYGVFLKVNHNTGYLSFNIYSSNDFVETWKTARGIVSDFSTGATEISHMDLENSISSIANDLATKEPDSYEASVQNILDGVFKKKGTAYKSYFLRKLNEFTPQDIQNTISKYVLPLFDSEKSITIACVPSTKVDVTQQFLNSVSYETHVEHITADRSDSEESSEGESGDESD